MSPDDANPTETEPAGDAEETKPKKTMGERMAFLTKGGEKFDNVKGFNKIPRSLRVLTLLIIVVLVVVIVMALMMMGGGDDKPPTNANRIDPAKLEDFSWSSGPTMGTASEFQQIQFTLDGMLEGNGTILVDSISMTLEWQ
ncbi:MAG: hypothetical protein JSW25_03705, partial [Thermoplasmata archaeon]